MRLENKVIIVTGSTTGIGEAIARRCVAEGACVLIHGRDRRRGEAIVGALGDKAALHIDDLADPAAASAHRGRGGRDVWPRGRDLQQRRLGDT